MTDFLTESMLLHVPAVINGKNGEISLFNDKIVWRYNQLYEEVNNIHIIDIMSLRDNCDFSLKNRLIQSPKTINKNPDRFKNLKIVIYSIVTRSSNHCQLNILSTIVCFDDDQQCTKWRETINELLSKSNFDNKRPKSLAVFINPIGGCKKGEEVYNCKVKPIFDLAGIEVNVTVTKKRDEAKDFIISEQCPQVDGLVCVGGDGMLMELINGLLIKARLEAGHSEDEHTLNSPEFPSPMRVGIIAAGSTDSVAFSTIGTKDVISSALHIVKGSTISVDTLTVHGDNSFLRYNISLMGYGFFGNCVSGSESLRWMGPKRYDYLGFKHFMSLTTYYGELKYVPVNSSSGHPRDGKVCEERCDDCSKNNTLEDSNGQQKDWVTVRDDFVAINSFLISCRCKKSPIGPAPYAHLGNGCSDLVIVRECNRFSFLHHLLKSASYDDHFDYDFVETIRVSEFTFTALENGKKAVPTGKQFSEQFGVWNCDGEPIYPSNVHCKVHRQLIKLFASGIPNPKRPSNESLQNRA